MPIRIGVLGTSDIAERRMIPAIKKNADFEYVGVAIADQKEWGEKDTLKFNFINETNKERARVFVDKFDGKYYESFFDLLSDENIDAVYIPLPPALHKKWIIEALNKGKNVISEKPITCCLEDTKEIIELAKVKKLSVIENYGFVYHKQIKELKKQLKNGVIGDLRTIVAKFGFPHRKESDFRYSNKLGGGALLDCGGYTIKAITSLLGNDVNVKSSCLVKTPGHEVDIYGNAYIENNNGECGFISFGMDNEYECSLSVWGSKGKAILNRAFTAPDNLQTILTLNTNNETKDIIIEPCDQFAEVLSIFLDSINDIMVKKTIMDEIVVQSKLVDEILKKGVVDKK